MHYAILVVGNDNLEEVMAPFYYDCEPETHIKNTMKELVGFYKSMYPYDNTPEDQIVDEIKSYYGEENFDEYDNLVSKNCSNAMFDYFIVGGRFCGLIEVKDGANVVLGEEIYCCMEKEERIELIAKRRGDIAKKGDIVNSIELVHSVYGIIYEGEFCVKNDFIEYILPTLSDDVLFTVIDCHG